MDDNKNKENTSTEKPKGIKAHLTSKRVLIYAAFTMVGVVGGYLYYHFFGCTSGCTITSSPTLSMLWGGVMGFLLPGVFEKPKKKG